MVDSDNPLPGASADKQSDTPGAATDTDSFDAKAFLATVTHDPGVYQMLDRNGEVLYVGKAKNLKNRIASYFRARGLEAKTVALVAKIQHIQVTVTRTETEALILEQSLIKSERPPYNILLRDDKSYPYILLTKGHEYPRLAVHRGAKRESGRYFGPYPNATAVRDSLNLLQKLFKVRQCEDSFFQNRSRPCLQYQIERCSGPCTQQPEASDYANQVQLTELFLDGESQKVIEQLAQQMERAAAQLEFESAALYRDQIRQLRTVQETQYVEQAAGDIDVVAVAAQPGGACIHVLFIRKGQIRGSRSFYPRVAQGAEPSAVLSAFVQQFYLQGGGSADLPNEILSNGEISEAELLQLALYELQRKQVKFQGHARGDRAQWVKMGARTAEENLATHLVNRQQLLSKFEQLQDLFDLPSSPQRIECFDISHTGGEMTVASCVVFGPQGALKSDYRRFNIDGISPGDDYAAMHQALTRRYTRLKEGEGPLPDILLIDGGKGQLSQAAEVLLELQVDGVTLVGVAKGPTRKAGFELLYRLDQGQPLQPPPDSGALHLIQQVRDEAHRFAVSGHKQRRDKQRRRSTLEQIPGVGPKRRRALLLQFGGLQELRRASVEEMVKVPGISQKLAEDIYAELHSG